MGINKDVAQKLESNEKNEDGTPQLEGQFVLCHHTKWNFQTH